jgi:hypothetical protein
VPALLDQVLAELPSIASGEKNETGAPIGTKYMDRPKDKPLVKQLLPPILMDAIRNVRNR